DAGAQSPDAQPDTDMQADAQPDAADGIVVYVGSTVFDASLNPVKNSYNPYSFTNCALLTVAPDSSYVGDMAESWTVSEDALTYTYTLKDGLKFSDGSDLTAGDVVFTYETVKANQAENEDVDLTRLASVEQTGDRTVAFTLAEPYSAFLDATALLGIVPSDAYDADAFDRYPVGSGPWKVVQYDASQQIIVEPNEYYYEGAPAIPRVTLVNMDASAALAAAQSGQLDVVMVGPDYATQTAAGMTLRALETMDIRNVSLPVTPVHMDEASGETVGNDVTADPAVRKALNIGIDRAAIIQNAFNGIGKPAQSFTANLPWAEAVAVDDGRKDEAAALLDEAGWTDADGDGIREKGGQRCAFDVYAAEDRYVLAAALAEDAKALGIEIVPHSSDWGEIGENRATAGVVWGWGQYSPTVLYALLDSKAAFDGYNNVVGYNSPEVDALIDKALGETSQDAALEDWKQVQRLASEDVPYLYLVNIEHCYFVSDRVDISEATQIPHPHGHGAPILCNLKDWTLR
ncbi:MAG: ABC transporter substrate-binding protein, partial [Clostridiales Family XIII bacterium]|nr:ABC transporter substrate-binding protein [Clostridiales Family XIII bacterium]